MGSLIECKNRNTKNVVNTLEKIQKRMNRMSKFYVPSLIQKVVCETYTNNEKSQTIDFKRKFSSKNLKKALKTLENTIYKLKKSKSEIFPLKNTSDVFSNNLNEILVNFDKMCLLLKRTYKDINHYYKVININWRYKMNKEDYFNEERIKLEQLLMEQIKEYRNLLDGILKDLDLIIKPLK